MSMTDTAQEILNANGYEDWTVVDDAVLECPCGHLIEWDGICPEGHVSPLRELGMI